MKLIPALFLLAVSLSLGAKTVCAPAMPRFLDPHQMINPLQLEMSQKLFLTLMPVNGRKGLFDSWTTKDGVTWTFKLREGLRFHHSQGWRSSRPINALDVEFGLNRQLARNAESDYEKGTFLPARWAGLEDAIKSIKVLRPYELELVFARPLQQRDLEALLAPPVGYVTSKEFVNWPANDTKQFLFHAASGDYDYDFLSDGVISLVPAKEKLNLAEKKGLVTYKTLDTEKASLKQVDEAKCDLLFNPTLALLNKLKAERRDFEKVVLIRSKVVFHLSPELGLKKETLDFLRDSLRPEKFKPLDDYPKLASIFNTIKYYPSGKRMTEAKKGDRTQLYFCRSAVSGVLDYEYLAELIAEQLKKILGVEAELTPLTCNQLYSAIHNEDALGVLKPVIYREDQDLLQQIACEKKSGLDSLGFCVSEAVRFSPNYRKETDAEFVKFRYLFPLVDIENFYLKF